MKKIRLKESWSCPISGCVELNTYTYGLAYEGKLYRISFSRSLLKYIRDTYFPNYDLVRFRYKVGHKLNYKEKSPNNVYAIMSSKNDKVLRISLIKEFAEELCDYEYRYLSEVYLEVDKKL